MNKHKTVGGNDPDRTRLLNSFELLELMAIWYPKSKRAACVQVKNIGHIFSHDNTAMIEAIGGGDFEVTGIPAREILYRFDRVTETYAGDYSEGDHNAYFAAQYALVSKGITDGRTHDNYINLAAMVQRRLAT